MKNLLLTALLLACASDRALGAGVPILPFSEVRSGMRGTGRTVFQGTTVESFDVEIIGKLPKIGPEQDLILGRCSGGPLERTGVLAGMSGSPVLVDGKLVGAIAYTWSFTTEPIAGITPIEEMLAVSERDPLQPARRVAALPIDGNALEPLRAPEKLAAFFDRQLQALVSGSGAALPTSVPLSLGGMTSAALAPMMPELVRAGFVPFQVGAAGGDAAATAAPIEPGSAIGLKLLRGDLDMTAIGTVTWIDGDRLLAFGHPVLGLGAVDLPLTAATVHTLLPSLRQSSKLAAPLGEVGALRQDRIGGVFGRLGADPRMIPVRLQLGGEPTRERAFSFDIADDPLLAPLLLYASLNGVLSSRERVFGSTTVRLREGSVIKLLDGEDVSVDNVFSGQTAFSHGTGIAAYILYLLMNNVWAQPEIAGVNLILDYDELPRSARIRRVSASHYRTSPGDTVRVTVVLQPYRGPDVFLAQEIVIPDGTPPGPLTLQVGGAQATSQAESRDEPVLPQDLDQLIQLINLLRRNDRIYILGLREDTGALLGATHLPNLPPSVGRVLFRPRSQGNLVEVPRRVVLEEGIATDFAVAGSARLLLDVESR
jgi:hypothetical protein